MQLIFDIGVNDGTDSAYYLRHAERVVGIEASPPAVQRLKTLFENEIAAGRYILLNVGIAAPGNSLEFWVCEDHPEWSSFDRSIASRNGSKHHAVFVQTRDFSSLIHEYGVPDYVKIDIEGNDRLCLQALTSDTAPPYISIEMQHSSADVDLSLLKQLGYHRFKIINQRTMTPAVPWMNALLHQVPSRISGRVRKVDQLIRGISRDGEWVFPIGSSGPFGERTPGRWIDNDQALAIWRGLRDLHQRSSQDLADWFDIHACR